VAFTPLDRQLLLIQSIGDIDPITGDPIWVLTPGASGIILQNAERIWNEYFSKMSVHPTLGPELFDQYFMRRGVRLKIAVLESRVTFSAIGTAMRVQLSDRLVRAENQLEGIYKEIVRLERRLVQLSGPVIGTLTQITPVSPPVPGQLSSPHGVIWTVDADDPVLSGSPYWGTWTQWGTPSSFR
jgi:hypothetical protein